MADTLLIAPWIADDLRLPVGAHLFKLRGTTPFVFVTDDMEIYVANFLLGAGRPLFADIGDSHIKL